MDVSDFDWHFWRLAAIDLPRRTVQAFSYPAREVVVMAVESYRWSGHAK